MSNTTTDVIPTERPPASGGADDRGAAANPIKTLQGFDQSVWLDYLRRSLFTSGEFTLVERDRRALRVHRGPDVSAGLHALETAVMSALQGYTPSH